MNKIFCGALLGFIAFTGLLTSVHVQSNTSKLEKTIQTLQPKIQTRSVIGNPDIPETFYNTPEGRAYLTVDGKPVDEYLRSR